MLDLAAAKDSNTQMTFLNSLTPGLIILGYLFGSLASAIIVCRLMGLSDPRASGSGNPGATNVLRLHGKKAAALTLAGDLIKGLVPVLLAKQLDVSVTIVALTGLAAFLGHLFPLFFAFKGGKGVATFIGVLFASDWRLGLAFVSIWLLMAAGFRFSSLAALTAAALIPVICIWIPGQVVYVFSFTVMAMLLFWRHRSNIQNLIAGKENRIGSGK